VNPVASLGTNPVDYYNSNSSSMTFDFKCSDNIGVSTIQLWSNFSGTWSANYSNSNYANDTWLNITLNNIPSGIWKWGVFCNDSAGNTNWTTNRTVMVDTIYPQFINSTTSPATGGNYNSSMNYLFNVTITNTNGTAGIEFNGTNYSLSNSSNNFYKTFSNLGAGTYSYYYWAFGTGINNRYNASQAYSYTINKATPTLTKSINGIDNNLTLTYPQQINASATTNAGTLKIYMNDSEITNGQNYSLAAGYYRFDFNVTGNENYTNTYGTLYVTINKASGDISLLLNGTAGNLSLVYGSSVNASIGTLYGSATLYRNGTNVTTENNQNITLAAGYYNYTAYSTGNQNYSSATISRFVNITKATPPLSCSGSSNTYPASISFSGSGCPTQGASDVTCSLTNPTPAGCPSCSGSSCSILCTAGTYNSTYATSGDQNWSSYTSTSCSATENKGSPTLSLTPSKNITYGAVAGMTGSTSDTGNADCIYTLYRNGSAYGNGTSVTDNTVLAVGLYLYAYNTSGCANYTTTANSSSLTVNKANDSLNLSLNGEVNQNISVVYPATITAIGYSLSNTDQVYRNGTLINESIAEPLGMGTYVYKINSTGNTNYNANSTGLTYYAQVNQTSSSVNLLINGNDSNASVMVEQNVNITASRTSGEGIINLYEDGQLINNGTSTLTNTTSYMAEGTHNITVFYSATQNYTASSKTHFITVIDNVPPVVSLQSPANDTWNNSLTLLYAYYANDTHSGLQNCSFYFDNTLKQTNCSVTKGNNQFNYTGTAGIHNWYITCYDNSSQKNGKTSDSWIIKLDNLSPTTTILGVANTTYASNVSITFSASDNGDSGLNRTEYNLTGACSSGWANYTSAINCGNEGSTTVYYRSIDNAGNIETTNALAFSIDKTGPLVTITSPSNGANISGTISFNATAIDNGINASHVVFKIDSTALTDDLTPPFSTTLTTTSYADGTHTLTAVAYDNVGNANSTNITIFTDNTKPNSTIIYPSNNFLTKANVTINATATDTGVGVDYVEIYNGTVWKNATHSGSVWTYNISFGTAGTYNIKSRATDKLGNQETPSGGINVIVDNVPPTISNINANPNPVSNATSLSISVVASDTNGVSSVNATLNGTTTALNSSGGTTYSSSLISPSTEGAYNLTILAVDNAGNSVNNSLYQVDVNASTPIITITPVNGAAITNGTSITINVSNAQTVQYNTTSNTTLTTISGNSTTLVATGAEGNYTVYVWANTSSGTQANKSNTYIIDNTPPIIYVNAVTTPTNIISQNISGNVTEANLDYVTVNGNLTNLNGNNYYRVVSLNEGNNTINMTAYDKAGQSNSTIRYVFLDTLTPTTTHSISGTLGENGWYTSDIILTLTVDDGSQSSGYTASYDSGAGFVTYSSPITLNETSTIIYRTIDNADNAESNKTTGQIKIDKEAPLITNVTFSTSLPAVNEPLTIRANITDSNALAAQQNISIDETNYSMTLESADIYKYDFTPTQSKNYSVIIYGKDIAGNYATQAESFNVGESKSENWEFSNTTTTDRNYTSTVDTQLNISVNASVTGNITVLLFTSQPDIANTSLSNAVKYVDVNLSNNINDVLQWILIKVYYNTSEISGLNESTLKLAWYNVSSGTWVTLAKGTPDWVNDAGVDTVNHYVWVNVTHLSLYGLTGTNVTTTPPSFTTSSSGGSGGGGGGGGASTGISVSLAKGNANITVSSISAGNMTNVTIAKYQDIAFRQINISVLNSVNNIKIVITKLPSLPASVNHDISGKVYHYIQVDNTNFTDNDLSKVYIKFAVNKTWLTDNGVDFSNISLYRWTNNRWNELTTTFLSNDSYEDFYQAESPGLSYFLIGTKGGEVTVTPCIENWSCTDWSACINNQQTRTCMDANACGTTVSKPVESQNCISTAAVSGVASWVYPSIAIVIIIIIVVLLFVFRKKIIPTSSKISEKK